MKNRKVSDKGNNTIKATLGTSEKDEALIGTYDEKEAAGDDTSDSVSSAADDVNEVRRLRTLHINEWLTDERVQEIMEDVQAVVRQGTRDSGANAIAVIRDTLNEAQ